MRQLIMALICAVGMLCTAGHYDVATAAGQAVGELAGEFTPAGTTSTPRIVHSSTRLGDGRILIAGGSSANYPSVVEASTELYDPVARSFQSAANLTVPRSRHTATLLIDGRVLIAGGYNTSRVEATAEIYDPTTNTFTMTGAMTSPRWGHTAVLLADGRVFMLGSFSADIYNPQTGSFASAGDLAAPYGDTATLLKDGTVLITVLDFTDWPYRTHGEIYDPVTDTFAPAGDMVTFHLAPTVTPLSDGKVLFVGGDVGDGGDGASVVAELYDPQTGRFTETGRLTTGRQNHTATLLTDGTVLIAGGHGAAFCGVPRPDVGGGFDNCTSSELYDPVTGAFRRTGDMATGRDNHAASLLNDGSVLITGGAQYYACCAGTRPTEGVLSSAELYTRGYGNLLQESGFEGYHPPALGLSGWISDDAVRQTAAFSETHQPRTGANNGACWTPAFLDCGLYQAVVAPATGTYSLTMFASADRDGGWVGANRNGSGAVSVPVETRPFGEYVAYTMTFPATAGDLIHVWMYSPATPGYVVIDDVTLRVQ